MSRSTIPFSVLNTFFRPEIATRISPELSQFLDAVRGYAALVVLVAHVVQWFILPVVGAETPIHYAAGLTAHLAVLVFFVLSGFVITHSLSVASGKSGAVSAGKWLTSRCIRIVPPHFSWR